MITAWITLRLAYGSREVVCLNVLLLLFLVSVHNLNTRVRGHGRLRLLLNLDNLLVCVAWAEMSRTADLSHDASCAAVADIRVALE